MSQGLINVAYIGATILFILALGGLSKQETARRGNLFGMIGMGIALVVTIIGLVTSNYAFLIGALVIGGSVGLVLAKKVEMTQMPELVAILHSLVGLAAVLVGYANFLSHSSGLTGAELTIHHIETYIGILIGALTFSGSVVAYLKLSGKWGGKPLLLPARHWLNLVLLILAIYFGVQFVNDAGAGQGLTALLIMTVVALLFGIHMVAAIGGADMPVVVSMLNSYSGWAAASLGFLLSNDLLIVVGALVGSSGAILSYIMCRAMNRNFIAVIAGGFGSSSPKAGAAATEIEGEVTPINVEDVADMVLNAKEVMIIPGYGMAVAQAQHAMKELQQLLEGNGAEVAYAIHPVAGRMPGHMNVLLAEADVSYEQLFEMDEINKRIHNFDVAMVIGANDVVNPAAREMKGSPIYGMPVINADLAKNVFVLKRGMASGFAGVDNPLFFKPNTRMIFGDAKETLNSMIRQFSD